MADRHLALERAQLLLVEDLRHEPEIPDGHDLVRLGCRDPRRLLAPVLKGVEGEVGEPGDVALRRVHAEHTALVARPVPEIEILGSSG